MKNPRQKKIYDKIIGEIILANGSLNKKDYEELLDEVSSEIDARLEALKQQEKGDV